LIVDWVHGPSNSDHSEDATKEFESLPQKEEKPVDEANEN